MYGVQLGGGLFTSGVLGDGLGTFTDKIILITVVLSCVKTCLFLFHFLQDGRTFISIDTNGVKYVESKTYLILKSVYLIVISVFINKIVRQNN